MRLKARFAEEIALTFIFAGGGWLAVPASAQSFCDLVPAAAVQAALGISGNLRATPNTQGGNGCDYKLDATGPTTVIADSTEDASVYKMVFDQRLSSVGASARVPVGDAAYYVQRNNQQIPSIPGKNFTQQSLVFRGKGKIVSFIVMTAGSGVPKSAILALGSLALSKPLNTLKDPAN